MRKFEQGLRPNIYIPAVAGLHKTYKDSINSALRVEVGIQKRQLADREHNAQKRRPSGSKKRGLDTALTKWGDRQPGGQQKKYFKTQN